MLSEIERAYFNDLADEIDRQIDEIDLDALDVIDADTRPATIIAIDPEIEAALADLDELVLDDEEEEPVVGLDDLVPETFDEARAIHLPAPVRVAGFANRRRRTSKVRDLETLGILSLPASSTPGASSSSSVPTFPLHIVSSPASSPAISTTRKRPAAAWEKTTIIAKAAAYNRAVAIDGMPPIAWTLNLSKELQASAYANVETFKAKIRNRIARELKIEFGEARDFAFIIETTRKAGRVHLHGAVAGTDNELPRLHQALARAGGTWSSSYCSERQAHAVVQFRPEGWSTYSLKDLSRTAKALGSKHLVAATAGCKRRGRALWESRRSATLA